MQSLRSKGTIDSARQGGLVTGNSKIEIDAGMTATGQSDSARHQYIPVQYGYRMGTLPATATSSLNKPAAALILRRRDGFCPHAGAACVASSRCVLYPEPCKYGAARGCSTNAQCQVSRWHPAALLDSAEHEHCKSIQVVYSVRIALATNAATLMYRPFEMQPDGRRLV